MERRFRRAAEESKRRSDHGIYDVLERRRTVRDFSHKEVSDALLKKVLAAAFCAPTNDHLHQLEFIVIRDKTASRK